MSNDSWQERLEKEAETHFTRPDSWTFVAGGNFGYAEGRKDERESTDLWKSRADLMGNRAADMQDLLDKERENAKALVDLLKLIRVQTVVNSYDGQEILTKRISEAIAKYNATLAGGEK